MRTRFKNVVTVVCIFLCIVFFATLSSTAIKNIVEQNNAKKDNTPTISTSDEYKGKTVSFLGDSITTFNGYSNNSTVNSTIGNNGYYYTSAKMSVNDTYWKRVIKALDMTLCVNNSWDGGRVTDTKEGVISAVARASQLHNDKNGVYPDVIIVNMGTNDVANGIDLEDFTAEYREMLSVIKEKYPEAEVYCCTILPESRTEGRKNELIAYNSVIRSEAKAVGVCIIDFYSDIPNWDYTSLTFTDGTLRVHPTSEGMEKLANCIIATLTK